MNATESFRRARDFLIAHREDYDGACAGFRWPELSEFNWATHWFDVLARGNGREALRVVGEDGTASRRTFAELSETSDRVAAFLHRQGLRRGDRVLVMLPNVAPLWEIALGAMKLGAVVSPASTLLTSADLSDRIERGRMRAVVTDETGREKFASVAGDYLRILVGGRAEGWGAYEDAHSERVGFRADGTTRADDPLLLYFTSGTTARPKLVLHTHRSYPVGHLSTMYWIGLREHDLHCNISSPGWAKHAWSSFFAPWNAGASIFVPGAARFDAAGTLALLSAHRITALCAPPTVWRMLVLENLEAHPMALREVVGAGEPLNPEVIAKVQEAWGLTIRDGYGQTETTCQIGNSPGQEVRPGSMGRPLPGYDIALLDEDGRPAKEGEIAIHLRPRPAPMMAGYDGDPERNAAVLGGDYYRTSDTAYRDDAGYLWYVGRSDDVFKSADYRISPFELESALLEHEAVAEAACVPSPDPLRLCVPKAFVVLKPGREASRETAASILAFARRRLAPFQRIRRLEFGPLPKTISGKIRRVELRAIEVERRAHDERGVKEFWEDEFPEIG
ncbi:MAG TPA: AMP-binding protein [Thermoanaerobaculia bacterium]|nr:AMP-binding protein [Thermoanaerobaculia bacterium]